MSTQQQFLDPHGNLLGLDELFGVESSEASDRIKLVEALARRQEDRSADQRSRAPIRKVSPERWSDLKKKNQKPSVPYATSCVFKRGDVVEHQRFGLGFVIDCPRARQVEVLFSGGLRKLVHNR